MRFKVLTLFPEMFKGFVKESIIGKAIDKNIIEIDIENIRDYSTNKHKRVDDMPYGGGPGMVMTPQPLKDAILSNSSDQSHIIFLSPKGQVLNQSKVKQLSKKEEIMFICGHYEGIDQRIIDKYVDEEISIGDYVLTGGELPAMVSIDAITRILPGAIGREDSYKEDSHYNGLLDHPHYTRPQDFDGDVVPDVLLSGHHKNIERWRYEQSIIKTYERRPDLIDNLVSSKKLEEKDKNRIENTIKKHLK